MKYAEVMIILIFAFNISCQDSTTEIEEFVGNGRLNINGSIDSVKIGDLPERVMKLLGEPIYWIVGDFDGFGYGYEFGNVTFMKIPIDSIYTVTFTNFNSKYMGETLEGIGMGSLRTDVLKKIRQPDKQSKITSDSSTSYIDSYNINKSEKYYNTIFLFYYNKNEILYRINMNYYR